MYYIVGVKDRGIVEDPQVRIKNIRIIQTIFTDENYICKKYCKQTEYNDTSFHVGVIGVYNNGKCYIKNTYILYINIRDVIREIFRLKYKYGDNDILDENEYKDKYVIIDLNSLLRRNK